MRTGQLKAGAVVIKGRVQPRTRVVALFATLREIRRHVVRICRPLIVLQMTTHAGSSGQVVVVVGMAVRALTRWHCMHPGQGEVRQAVVKRRVRPRSRVVALGAGLGKASRYVVGIGGALIVLQMAGHTCDAAQAEVVVDMAVGAQARRDRMCAGEWEAHRGVIEVRIEPGIGAVA